LACAKHFSLKDPRCQTPPCSSDWTCVILAKSQISQNSRAAIFKNKILKFWLGIRFSTCGIVWQKKKKKKNWSLFIRFDMYEIQYEIQYEKVFLKKFYKILPTSNRKDIGTKLTVSSNREIVFQSTSHQKIRFGLKSGLSTNCTRR